jgi:hypothetical protein
MPFDLLYAERLFCVQFGSLSGPGGDRIERRGKPRGELFLRGLGKALLLRRRRQ